MKIDIPTRLFFVFILTLLFGAIILSYYRFYHLRDYEIASEMTCDPAAESCFVRECKEGCEDVPLVEFYKIVTKRASLMSTCDPHTSESCDPFSCDTDPADPFSGGCSFLYCDADNVPEGERCSSEDDAIMTQEEESEGGNAEEDVLNDKHVTVEGLSEELNQFDTLLGGETEEGGTGGM